MLTFERVLFPTDFSETANEALAQAAELARFFSAELVILHVLQSWPADGSARHGYEELFVTLEKEAQERISALTEVPALTIRRVVRQGDAVAPTLLAYAEEAAADLIVMATHGRRGLRKWWAGSVTQEVVREADRPVLTLRRREHGFSMEKARSFLVPIDFSEPSRQALQQAKELAAQAKASLQLLHVIGQPIYPNWYPAAGGILGGDAAAITATRYNVTQLLERANEELAAIFRRTPGPDVPFETHVEEGRPADQILELSAAKASDLIVMASHGLSGLSHLLLGSVTESVMQRANRPLLILRSKKAGAENGKT